MVHKSGMDGLRWTCLEEEASFQSVTSVTLDSNARLGRVKSEVQSCLRGLAAFMT